MILLMRKEHNGKQRLFIKFPYNERVKATIKMLFKDIRYSASVKSFYIDYSFENYKRTVQMLKKQNLAFRIDKSLMENLEGTPDFEKYVQNQLQKFVDYLRYKNYSKVTIKAYENLVYHFLMQTKKQVEHITIEDIEIYNKHYIIEKRYSLSYQNQLINAIKLFFIRINNIHFDVKDIERPRKSTYLPTVLSQKEIKQIFKNIDNLKHLTILSLIYSSGLRIGEALRLKVKDIDSERNIIFIQQSKGHKDRVVGLSPKLLTLLRTYYKKYRPKEYLFEGQNGGMYTASSVRQVFKRACKKAGIHKPVRVHSLRHSYATHLLELGTDIRYIQDILGHKDPKTTMIYTHVTNKEIKKIISPFDMLDD